MAKWTMVMTDEDIEAALAEAQSLPPEIDILEASYHAEPGLRS